MKIFDQRAGSARISSLPLYNFYLELSLISLHSSPTANIWIGKSLRATSEVERVMAAYQRAPFLFQKNVLEEH